MLYQITSRIKSPSFPLAINEGFCFLKMMKCRRWQATDSQKFKKIVNSCFFVFLLVEAEAIGVEAEAVEK